MKYFLLEIFRTVSPLYTAYRTPLTPLKIKPTRSRNIHYLTWSIDPRIYSIQYIVYTCYVYCIQYTLRLYSVSRGYAYCILYILDTVDNTHAVCILYTCSFLPASCTCPVNMFISCTYLLNTPIK